MMTKLLRLVPVLMIGLTACASATPPAGDARDPGDLVLRVSSEGGFVPIEYHFTSLPEFSLLGDGRAVTVGPQIEIYPGPALPNLQQTHITAAGIDKIIAAARDAGIDRDRDIKATGVADAPTTVFTLVTSNGKIVVKVEALGIDGGGSGMGSEEIALRKALQKFKEDLSNLKAWLGDDVTGPEKEYAFDELRIRVGAPATSPEPSITPQEKVWPLAAKPLATFGSEIEGGFRCGTVDGADLTLLLPHVRSANQLTNWTSGGKTYHLLFRPLLADESGC